MVHPHRTPQRPLPRPIPLHQPTRRPTPRMRRNRIRHLPSLQVDAHRHDPPRRHRQRHRVGEHHRPVGHDEGIRAGKCHGLEGGGLDAAGAGLRGGGEGNGDGGDGEVGEAEGVADLEADCIDGE